MHKMARWGSSLATLYFITQSQLALAQTEMTSKSSASGAATAQASPTSTDSAQAASEQDASEQNASEQAPAEQDAAAQETGASDSAAEVDPYAEARERVARAEVLYEQGNFDAALTEFRRAYETMLGHPARPYVLYNIGRCEEKLYRYDAAIASYKEYLETSPKDADDRATVTAKIELLEGLLGTVKVSVRGKKGASVPSYEVWVDGRLIGENQTSFLIPGGGHQVEIRAEGFESQTREVQIAARTEGEVSVELSPLAKEYKGIPQPYFWTAATLTGAAAIFGTTFGVMAVTKRSEINGKAPAAITQDDQDAVKKRALIADIGFVSAGVLAASATVLAFMTDWDSQEEATTPDTNIRVKEIAIAPSPQGAFMQVGGTF